MQVRFHSYPNQDYAYHYPQYAYPDQQTQSGVYQQNQAQHSHLQQGYYYQPLYHCPTCGTPVYMVYIPVPQVSDPPKGIAALLVAVLILLSLDIVFFRRR